jgi:tRNA A-37 threonylcarbamoyl transferase component Bud32
MNIFLSYASDRRDIAEQVYFALISAGYKVFFDRDSLPGGDDYHKRIRKSVEDSEAFVFLISPKSVAEGSYTRTELKYAREKWSDPRQRILPVMIEPTEFQQIPNYLKSVAILKPEGSVPAEVTAALEEWHVDAQRTFDPKRAWLEEKLTPRYKIEKQLGQRNSAMVYKAFDSILQRNVVIKVFVDNRYQDKFDESLREAVRVSDEPSFITIYDACLKEELRYYVMQFIDGPTLRERIDDYAGQWIPVETTRKIFLSIGYALVRAYSMQFNPGNIKPSNIVLTKDDQPFISSLNRFGILSASRLLQELKSRVPNLGERARLEELAYLLPEQFEGQLETVSPERSAQYMLGLVAYELIMGEIPPTLRSLKELEDKGSLAFQKLPAITAKRPHCPQTY